MLLFKGRFNKNSIKYFGQVKKYDWRDDPKYNPDLLVEIRHKGWDPSTYTTPYNKSHDYWLFNHESYSYDLKYDLKPENRRMKFITEMHPPVLKLEDDILHELDFESEDLDFQPDEPNMQHFKKTHSMYNIYLILLLPFFYLWVELIFQHYPDEDHWKKPFPPPLDYPNPQDTPDTATYNLYHSARGQMEMDRGIYTKLGFEIKDGKKVYDRFAGVNQPMDIL